MLYVTGFLGSELARAAVHLSWKLLLVSPSPFPYSSLYHKLRPVSFGHTHFPAHPTVRLPVSAQQFNHLLSCLFCCWWRGMAHLDLISVAFMSVGRGLFT